jgi:hypothetical protein
MEMSIIEPLGKGDAALLQQAGRPSTNYLYNIKFTSEMQIQYLPECIAFRTHLPVQITPPTGTQLSQIAKAEYYRVIAKDYDLIAEGTLEGFPEPLTVGASIPINSVTVWKESPATAILGNPTGFHPSPFEPNRFVLLFLSDGDFRKLGSASISVKNIDGRWYLEVAQEPYRVQIWYGQGKLEGVPLKMIIETPNGVEQCEATSFKSIDGIYFQEKIKYLYQSKKGAKTEISFSLKDMSKLSQVSSCPDLPLGIFVYDFRHLGDKVSPNQLSSERAAIYKWAGRLPTLDELKQRAYQQGNLVPPETPRRRYSPWLLLPAILFFLAAGYLYFKNRRGHSARPNR